MNPGGGRAELFCRLPVPLLLAPPEVPPPPVVELDWTMGLMGAAQAFAEMARCWEFDLVPMVGFPSAGWFWFWFGMGRGNLARSLTFKVEVSLFSVLWRG